MSDAQTALSQPGPDPTADRETASAAVAATQEVPAAPVVLNQPEPTPDYEIILTVLDGHVRPLLPKVAGPLLVGQTVRYSSQHGTIRIAFPGESPYEVSEVRDSMIRTLQKPGQFEFRCFVTPAGETTEIGWSPQDTAAGADHDVHSHH